MGKQVIIDIKEAAEELDLLYRNNKSFKIKRRIKNLILTKSNKFSTREQLAKYLGVKFHKVVDES